MLVLTEAAAEVVKSLTSTPQAPGGTGLRIASSGPEPGDPGALQVTATAGPGENDQIISRSVAASRNVPAISPHSTLSGRLNSSP